jgi:hypothetical protein
MARCPIKKINKINKNPLFFLKNTQKTPKKIPSPPTLKKTPKKRKKNASKSTKTGKKTVKKASKSVIICRLLVEYAPKSLKFTLNPSS